MNGFTAGLLLDGCRTTSHRRRPAVPIRYSYTGISRGGAPCLVETLRRLGDARALGVSDLDLSGIPAGRLRVLARYASSARAQVFQRMPAERGIATLLAFACALQATTQDDVLDVLDMLLTDLLARVESQETMAALDLGLQPSALGLQRAAQTKILTPSPATA
jgi:hypothetical protein